VVDSEQIVVTVDVTKDIGAVDVAMTPKAGSRLAKFVRAQRPSDYGLLAKLPAIKAPMLFAGHIESGPYRESLLAMVTAMYGQGASKDVTDAMTTIVGAATGELAMAGQMAPKQAFEFTQLFGLADQKIVDKALDRLLDRLKGGLTIDALGVATTLKTSNTVVHDGVSLKGYDVTYDLSKLSAENRATMEKTIPTGKAIHASVSTFDHLGLATMGGADAAAAIDAARGKGGHFTPPPMIADFLLGSRARKESFVMAMDLAAVTGTGSTGQPVILSAGFADKSAHLRFTLAAPTVRALSGQP